MQLDALYFAHFRRHFSLRVYAAARAQVSATIMIRRAPPESSVATRSARADAMPF